MFFKMLILMKKWVKNDLENFLFDEMDKNFKMKDIFLNKDQSKEILIKNKKMKHLFKVFYFFTSIIKIFILKNS